MFVMTSDTFTNWKLWVLGPTRLEKYGSSVEFMGPLPYRPILRLIAIVHFSRQYHSTLVFDMIWCDMKGIDKF